MLSEERGAALQLGHGVTEQADGAGRVDDLGLLAELDRLPSRPFVIGRTSPSCRLLPVALLVVHVVVVSLGVIRAAFQYLVDGRHFRDSVYPEAASRSRGGQSQRDGDRVPGLRRRFALLWLENVVAQIGTRLLGIVAAYLLLTGLDMLLALRVWHAPALHLRLGIPLIYAAVGSPALAFLVPALAGAWNRPQLRKLVPGRSPECRVRTRRLAEIEQQWSRSTHRPPPPALTWPGLAWLDLPDLTLNHPLRVRILIPRRLPCEREEQEVVRER